MASSETIAAIATPSGRGAIGIVRVSGPQARTIATAILGFDPTPRKAHFARFLDANGDTLDEGLALLFVAPHSFTGEDVLELQGHGSPVVLDRLLKRVVGLGARLARPGEFSERAFLNDKLDLAQAEAIADLIASHTEAAARSALRSLEGAFSKTIDVLVEGLIALRAYVEAALDFPDEDIDFLADDAIKVRLQALATALAVLRQQARQGSLLREGITLVVAGRPNAGKSSLLNHLARREVAIVTPVAGTTRDVLREDIQIDGVPVRAIDTAGLHKTEDVIEREGIKRAWQAIENADLVLHVVDDTIGESGLGRDLRARLPAQVPVLTVWNKIDLSQRPPGPVSGGIALSVVTGQGMAALYEALRSILGLVAPTEGVFSARRRHLEALERAAQALSEAQSHLEGARAGELIAEELRAAQAALSEITGEFTSEDLLGRIFAGFCIGK